MLRISVLAAIVFAVGLEASAAPASGAPVMRLRTFTTRDGLSHDIVRDVLEDRAGALWFATMGGVTRYDPRKCSYETFTYGGSLPRQEAMSLALGRDGKIWVATQGGGVAAYDGTVSSWTWYSSEDGLPSDEITSLLVDRSGRVWATPTTGGIAVFDGDRWRTFTQADGLSSGEIGRCAELGSGEIVCGTYDHPLLQRYDGRRWSQIRVEAPAGRHFYVHAVTQSREGDLWLATKGRGAIQGRPTPGGYRWTVHDRTAGLRSDRVGAITQTRDGSLWFATSSGVSRYDGARWSALSRRDGLGANHVFAITQTTDGGLWFATLGGGVTRYGPSRWRRITEANGLASDNLTGGLLVAADGALWVGTDRGLSVLRNNAWTTVPELADAHVNHLLQTSDGAIWVATRDGLRHHTTRGWERFSAAMVVNRLAADQSGRLWAATNDGVRSYDTTRLASGAARVDGLPSRRVHDLLITGKGRVWAATNNGVARLEGRAWRPYLSPSPASRTNRIYSLARQASAGGAETIWASGLEGVNIFDGRRWRPMAPSAWLPAGIYSRFVIATSDGSLWFAVRGLGVRRRHRRRWTSYTSVDGLAADTVRDVALRTDKALLFATLGGGLSLYRPDRLPPQTYVGSLPTGGRGGARGAPSSVVQGEDLVLHFGGQDVLKDTRTEDLLYSYRVDGGAWSAFAANTKAWLADLSPGQHLFEVRAMDRDLNTDPTPARHAFRVLRPWWAEPWLLALVGLLLGLAVYAVIRILRAMARERAAVQREQATVNERRQFVRLASHELRKPLTRLAHRSEILAMPSTLDNRDKTAEYAEALVSDAGHLSKLVETLLEQARVQEAGLQLELERGELNELTRRLVGELVGAEPGPRLQLTEEAIELRYDPFYLPLAIHNLLDNACKYGGGPSAVEVLTEAGEDRATLTVRDRGPGIAPEDRQRIFEPFIRGKTRPEHGGFGLGLSFARDIARSHGGDLELRDPADGEGGAAFCLWLPLV